MENGESVVTSVKAKNPCSYLKQC